jgi:hypothetical protein
MNSPMINPETTQPYYTETEAKVEAFKLLKELTDLYYSYHHKEIKKAEYEYQTELAMEEANSLIMLVEGE